jgi:hypothetical protein
MKCPYTSSRLERFVSFLIVRWPREEEQPKLTVYLIHAGSAGVVAPKETWYIKGVC